MTALFVHLFMEVFYYSQLCCTGSPQKHDLKTHFWSNKKGILFFGCIANPGVKGWVTSQIVSEGPFTQSAEQEHKKNLQFGRVNTLYKIVTHT